MRDDLPKRALCQVALALGQPNGEGGDLSNARLAGLEQPLLELRGAVEQPTAAPKKMPAPLGHGTVGHLRPHSSSQMGVVIVATV